MWSFSKSEVVEKLPGDLTSDDPKLIFSPSFQLTWLMILCVEMFFLVEICLGDFFPDVFVLRFMDVFRVIACTLEDRLG